MMRCNKCGQKSPKDSEFCQYCGERIKKSANVVTPTDTKIKPNFQEFENDAIKETLKEFFQTQSDEIIKTTQQNDKNEGGNEEDLDFGLVPSNPIYTFSLKSVKGEEEYLNRLYTPEGVKIKWERIGSTSNVGINGMIDIYKTYLPSGKPYKTIYINMYGVKETEKAPEGFVLNVVKLKKKQKLKKEKSIKVKYCGKCGSLIESKTAVCTGCRKKYFKGVRLNKFTVTVIVLVLLIVILLFLSGFQYFNIQRIIKTNQLDLKQLEIEINSLEHELSNKNETINSLETKNTMLSQLRKEEDKRLAYYDMVISIVKKGSNLYHKFGCSNLDNANGVEIMFTDDAFDKGYVRCTNCRP